MKFRLFLCRLTMYLCLLKKYCSYLCYNDITRRIWLVNILFDCIADTLIEYDFVDNDKREVFKYGLENLIISMVEILSVFFLSIVFNNTLYTAIFLATFISLRRYTGGYHAKTKYGCYAVFVTIYLIFSMIIKYISEKYISAFEIITLLFSWFAVMKYAPIANENKKINQIERKMFRKFGMILNLVMSGIVVLTIIMFPFSKVVLSIAIGQAVVSISMLVAIQLKRGCD